MSFSFSLETVSNKDLSIIVIPLSSSIWINLSFSVTISFEHDKVSMFVFSISLAETLKDVEKLNTTILLKINKDIFLFLQIPFF